MSVNRVFCVRCGVVVADFEPLCMACEGSDEAACNEEDNLADLREAMEDEYEPANEEAYDFDHYYEDELLSKQELEDFEQVNEYFRPEFGGEG